MQSAKTLPIIASLVVAWSFANPATAADTPPKKVGYDNTPMQPGGKWHIHDGKRPQPRIVTPGTFSTAAVPGRPPSDAVVLVGPGNDTSQWSMSDGKPITWKMENGVLETGKGEIRTRASFGDVQLHVEFATPAVVKGEGQGRGNSGVFLMGSFEMQVLDSYQNITYPDGQAAAMYGQYPPLVNASARPAEWQVYDIVFMAPRFKDGKLDKPATLTAFHNGVVVHNATPFWGPTGHQTIGTYKPDKVDGPLALQDHGNPIHYRNIWLRALKGYDGEVLAAAPPPPPVYPRTIGKDVTGEYQVPDGLEVKVWAESPQLYNPTNMDIDARGRIWITEGLIYRGRTSASRGFFRLGDGDRVVILEDTNGDGVADSSKVFVQDPELISPLGIAVIGNRVIVSCSPKTFVFTDTDGDDKSDKKEVFLTGFGGRDSDHGLHAFTFGPDGRYYFNAGNDGPHLVTDKSGFTVRHEKGNSDDGRRWIGGLVFRINPDGTGLRILAHNFRNNYEVGLDAFGNLWQNDNDDDGNASCRMTYVLEGGNYGYRSRAGTRGWHADRRVGQDIQTAHWHQDDPGVVPPTRVTGAGAPTGIVVYEGKLLPERFRGMVLNADAGRSTVWGHTVKAVGAGFESDQGVFMASRPERGDEARLFRPADVAVAPDGSVYVADWYDPMVGGHNLLDKTGYGRIFRIAPRGAAPASGKAATTAIEVAIENLLGPAVNVRALGWQALEAQGDAGLAAVRKRFGAERDARARARLLWFIAHGGAKGRAVLLKALKDRDPDLRVVAYRALRQNDPAFLTQAAALARDPSAAVRREVAISLRDLPAEKSGKLLLQLAASYDGQDRMYLEALGLGFEGKEDALWGQLSARLGSRDPGRWSKKFADLAWRLHPEASTAALKTRAQASSLGLAEQQRALVALAAESNHTAAEAMIDIAGKAAEPLKSYAIDLAFDRAGQEWRGFGITQKIKTNSSSDRRPEDLARLGALKTALLREGGAGEPRRKAALDLAGSKEGGLLLISLAAQGKLPGEVKDAVAESIFRSPDVGVRALASQYFKRPSFDGADYPPAPQLMKMKGDASRGRLVFFSDRAACSKCHEYAGQGGQVGPALTLIAGKLGREAILDSVLNPSAAIAFGYEPWVITTKDEQTFSGFILGEGESLLLREVSGETRLIPASKIAERHKEKNSLMPDNIALGMKPQELVDLVDFLASGNAQKAN